MPPLELLVFTVCVIAVSLYSEQNWKADPALMILWKPGGVIGFTMCVSVLVIKAVCAVRSCTGGRGGQEAQTFIKPQHHHLPGMMGVPSANTFTIFLTESFV